jgi:hypothetical protein
MKLFYLNLISIVALALFASESAAQFQPWNTIIPFSGQKTAVEANGRIGLDLH